MRLIAYYRVSTESQGLSGLGLEGQRANVEAYAERASHDIVASITEIASGGRDDRELLNGALESLRHGEADGLIFAKLDRLTRSLLHFSTLARSAEKQGWQLIAADGGIDMTTPGGKAMAGMLAVFAQFERDMISTRTKEGLAAKRARNGGKLKGNKPSVGPGVTEWIRERRKQGYTYGAIASQLTSANIPTAQGGKWHGSTVKYILDHAIEDCA